MTERLEEILKESPFNQHTEEFLIKLEDMNEITKIVEELESEIDGILQTLEDKEPYYSNLCLMLEKQNKRYREALEFYADRDNYKLEHFDPNLDDYMSTVDYDEGKTARNALEGEE